MEIIIIGTIIIIGEIIILALLLYEKYGKSGEFFVKKPTTQIKPSVEDTESLLPPVKPKPP